MTWNEFKLAVESYLEEHELEDIEIDYIDISLGMNISRLEINHDEYGLGIVD